jgi:hypothetical protein
MGKGTDAARDFAPAHAKMIDDLKEQLLIVFLKRLGGKVSIPVAEIDNTGQDLFAFRVDASRVFHFELRKKS